MREPFDGYDPVTIAMPGFWSWVKAGVGFTLGAGVAVSALWVVYMVGVLPWLARGVLAALR